MSIDWRKRFEDEFPEFLLHAAKSGRRREDEVLRVLLGTKGSRIRARA